MMMVIVIVMVDDADKKRRTVYHDARQRRWSSGCKNSDDGDADCFSDLGYMLLVM